MATYGPPRGGEYPSEYDVLLPTGQYKTVYLNPYSGRYTTSKSYAQRMQRNYARGLSQAEARGHGTTAEGVTESELRRQRHALEHPDITQFERFTMSFEQRYGFSYSYWRYLKRNWIDGINSLSSPDQQITPIWIQQELINSQLTGHDENWIEARLDEKLMAMEAYAMGDPEPGAILFRRRDSYAPIEWWWYHGRTA